MSIIWGRYNFDTSNKVIRTLNDFEKTFKHVQIDKKGIFHNNNNNIGLVNLLQFNTLESFEENLPYTSIHYPATITADCRLDNRTELLHLLNIEDKSITDSQLILLTYLKYKENCVKYLVGAFVFIIWDEQKQQLFCARDQMGVRPCFYYQDNKCFIFTSEKKGILSENDIDNSVDNDYIIREVTAQERKYDNTFYKHIKRLLPAHFIVVNKDGVKISRYWNLDIHQKTHYKKTEDYVAAFNEKMTEAIECRLRSHKNVGSELSGGLDSSGIAALAQEYLQKQNKELYTFSLSLPKELRNNYMLPDDYDKIVEVCQKANIKHSYHITKPHEKDFIKVIDFKNKIFDGVTDFSQIGGYPMKLKAKSLNVNVMLSGFPGDQLVTSYCKLGYLEYLERWQWKKFIAHSVKINTTNTTLTWAIIFLLGRISKPTLKWLIELKSSSTLKGKAKEYQALRNFLKEEILEKYPKINKKRFERTIKTTPPLSFREAQSKHVQYPYASLRMESGNLVSNHLGMEMRFPMSDIRLLQYVLSVPIEQKMNKDYTRLLFRRGLDGVLPNSVVWRKEEDETFATNPNTYIGFEEIYPQIDAFLKSLKGVKNLDFLDIEKLITLNDLRRSKPNWKPGTYAAVDRHGIMFSIARFFQENPAFKLKL